MIDPGGGFYVRLKMDKTIRMMKEVKSAFTLLWWFCGRVTREYSIPGSGIRIGAVLGGAPNSDADVAKDITLCGWICGPDQVYKWRRKLARHGLIAWKRTPSGARIFVIDSRKLHENLVDEIPDWVFKVVQPALKLYSIPPDYAEHAAKSGGAFRHIRRSIPPILAETI